MGFQLKENLVPDITTVDQFDTMMKTQFYSNFTSSRGSEVEQVNWNNPPLDSWDDYFKLNDPNQKFNHWKTFPIPNEFENIGGRRKACKSIGLTGAEKRACAKKLRQSGWIKGEPVPESITIGDEDVQYETETTTSGQKMPMSTGTKVGIALASIVAGGFLIYGISKVVKGAPSTAPVQIQPATVVA